MPTKLQTYTQIASETAKQLTSTHADWTSFLKTAARLYKYPYHEQLMIYAQRPEATACAEYDFWNERMGRYVRRGSKGIALIDLTGEQPKLRYVFDVSDTGNRERSRSVNLWEYKPEHEKPVSDMLYERYGVSKDNGIKTQLECVAAQLADEYWNAYSRDILDIVDDSFLYGYDAFNVGVAFRNAATVSITYSLLSRCGLDPDSYFDKEDFMSIFDWNTPEAVAELGTAVSVINQEVLRQIERTVKQYERQKLKERTDNHDRNILHEEGRLSSPEPEALRTANEPRQVRQDEEEVFAGTQTGAVQPPDSIGETAITPDGSGAVGSGETGADREESNAEIPSDGSSESLRPDEMGGTDELNSSDSGRNDPERTGLRIEDYPTVEQLSLFDISIPSQEEQIAQIDSADSVKSQSAFSIPQECIDDILRTAGNADNGRMGIVTEFSKPKTDSELAEYLKSTFNGGSGVITDNGRYSAWYADDGIHIAKGEAARYLYSAQIIPWDKAVERIRELLSEGSFATVEEVSGAKSLELKQMAEHIWYMHQDFSDSVTLDCFPEDIWHEGFPDSTERIADILSNEASRQSIIDNVSKLAQAYAEDKSIMRFQLYSPDRILAELNDLAPREIAFTSKIEDFPKNKSFITQDEIDDCLANGSGVSDGKGRIYGFFTQQHSSKERIDFLKNEYGIGGRSHALSGSSGSNEWHDGKGISLKKTDCADVMLTWSKVAERISGLISKDRYLTPQEKARFEEEQRRNAGIEDIPLPEPVREPDEPAQHTEPTFTTPAGREYRVGDGISSAVTNDDSAVMFIERVDEEDVWYTLPDVPEQGAVSIDRDVFERYLDVGYFAVVDKEQPIKNADTERMEKPVPEARESETIAEETQRHGEAEVKTFSHYEDYLSVKENHPDDVVLYQVGDFFEIFGEDAKTAAEKLTLHLTTRTLSDGTKTEMCGIPAYVLEENVEKLREEYPVSISAIDKSSGEHRVYSLAAISSAQVVKNEENPSEITTYTDNFCITEEADVSSGFSPKSKFRMNMEAIKLLKELESNGRQATREEQQTLSKYVGWGGLADAFDETKENWANEYAELKSVLSPEEYSAARASTLNAHYTSPTVIKAIYEAVENMGFKTGNILEPSMGVGNFFGLLPESMRDSKLYGVELDSISGRIAKQLYPKADITVAGFETTDRRDFFDLAVGNVPFGNYKVNDRAYNKLGFSIHDYFFAKTLDQVRSGGVIAFVTSRYTMDKQSPEVRRYIAKRAELLGAIRLPNNAFKANAGTEVVSDIIFLQKRDRPIEIEPDWVHLSQTESGQAINSYFADNPDMMLGVPSSESTQYGKEDFTLDPMPDKDLSELLHEAVKKIGGEYKETELYELGEDEEVIKTIPADPNVKNYSYAVVDGEVYFRENSVMIKPELNATALERVKSLVELRDCVHELIDLQLDEYAKDEDIQVKQDELNTLYDSFSAKYGLINDRGNRLAFSDDSSYYLLCSLEILNDEGKLERKADMFTKRTIRQQRSVEHVETAAEALAVSIGERAKVDLEFMSKLSGLSKDELVRDLHGVIFADPVKNEWQTADEYLSGNVRQKLREAKSAAADDPAFEINVSALTQAQPKDLEASDIEVRLGATWISKDYIRQFMLETFKPPIYLYGSMQVHYSKTTAEWRVEGKNLVPYEDVFAMKTFGTDRANAYKILEETLNLRDMRIYDTIEDADGKERRVLNQKETTLAAQKQQAIKDAFKDWLWKDPERRQALVKQYNEEMNSTRPREYDGKHITFAGMNPEISLREHQKNAVAHILYGGNTLLAHEVGAGKTFEMVAACMESKRLGLSQKSLFVVPNHLTGQWASEFLRLYPSANILVATKKDFETANRKKFCARIATGDYDAVIIGHSQFERIPISKERQQKILEAEIEDVTAGIAEVKSSKGERFTIKQLEKTKKGLETRLEKLQADHKKDDVVTFEQLGVDRMFVDESHNYKNLFLYTKMRNVAGLTTTDAQKSSDMFAKCRYLDEITGNRGVIFATGTPISNSMTELYTIQRYLQYDRLQQLGMGHFDCWASRFGETTTALELAPEGTGYRARTRFAKFYNLPELMNIYKEVADVKTSDQLNLPVPEAEFHNVVAHPTEHQKELVQQLSERASAVHSRAVDPSVDNMLKITSDGRKLGLDQRIINPNLPDEPTSKVNLCVNNIMDIWRNGQEDKLTQLVFCDISTPKASTTANEKIAAKSESGVLDPEAEVKSISVDSDFTVYDDIRKKLIDRGMPPEQIAFIHEANTDVKKKELFAKVRSGQVRVLIGSTFKMGAGTNVQDRLIALHDLDAPWRPGDLEQRKGRIVRQGNMNEKVHIYRYVTEGTFDAYLWQTLENKQKFISQIQNSKSPVRSCEDVDETALSFAEVKALCAGDPRIKEKMDLDVDVSRLKLLKADHQNKLFRMEDDLIKHFPEQIAKTEGFIAGIKEDMQTAEHHPLPEECFVGIVVRGDELTDKENASAALSDAIAEIKTSKPVPIGEYRGFSISVSFDAWSNTISLHLGGKMMPKIEFGEKPTGIIRKIEHEISRLPARLSNLENQLANLREQIEATKAELGKPFPQEEELQVKSQRLLELSMELDMDKGESHAHEEGAKDIAAKSERPSILEKLKQPAVSHSGQDHNRRKVQEVSI